MDNKDNTNSAPVQNQNAPSGVQTRNMLKNANKPATKDVAVQTEADNNIHADVENANENETQNDSEQEGSFDSEEEETVTDSEAYSEYEDEDDDENEDDEEYDEEYEEQQLPLQMPVVVIVGGPPPPMYSNQYDDRGDDDEDDQENEEDEEDDEDGCCGFDEERNYRKRQRGRKNGKDKSIPTHFTPQERAYFRKLPKPQQEEVLALHHQVESETKNIEKVPLKFRILQSDADPATKSLILKKIDQLQRMHQGSGEYSKLRNWLDGVSRLPLGKYHQLPVSPSDPTDKIAGFLQQVRKSLDETVYGHQDTKDEILKTFARWISSRGSRGSCIGLVGAPGVGKTNIIKEGLCKALGMKFGFVSLGGCSDGSFLDGHSFVYEGSQHGKIAEILMKTQCMNPILFFDEVDKISATRKGEEISGILTHLTDSTQNERFNDRYFTEIDLNLSKCMTVFSFNDESLVNPILRDRMTIIHVKGYQKKDKMVIARDYLIPKLLQDFNLKREDILISDAILDKIIEKLPKEEGVRDLKRALESIFGWMNMHRFIPDGKTQSLVTLPFEIKTEHLDMYMKDDTFRNLMKEHVLQSMYL